MKNKAEIREKLMKGNSYENARIETRATSMQNGAHAWWVEGDHACMYGRGSNWSDQGITTMPIEEAVSYLWKRRKDILKYEEVA